MLRFVLLLVELLLYGTGECLLYAFTLGKRKPRGPHEGDGSTVLKEVLYQGSTWLGFVFWALVLAGLYVVVGESVEG